MPRPGYKSKPAKKPSMSKKHPMPVMVGSTHITKPGVPRKKGR